MSATALQQNHIEGNYFLVDRRKDVIGRLGAIRVKRGDTLPDIARHYSLGINALRATNPGVDLWLPRAGEGVVLPLGFILPEAPREGIVINLASMRLFSFKRSGEMMAVSTFPVGVGTTEHPTPLGNMYITRKKSRPTWYVPASIAADHRRKGDHLPAQVPPGHMNPLGEYALYLSEPGYLVHGTNKPASVGLRATNGCIRLYPEDIKRLFATTPVRTPVRIVNQPYLVGLREGIVYLEAHSSFAAATVEELRRVFARLQKLERQHDWVIDWDKVETVVAEARGMPVVVSRIAPGGEAAAMESVRLRHPDRRLFELGIVYAYPENTWKNYQKALDCFQEIIVEHPQSIYRRDSQMMLHRIRHVIFKDNLIAEQQKQIAAYHLSLRLSYPNERDLRRARELAISPGGNIMIHGIKNGLSWVEGMHNRVDWTKGCIAVTNREMEEIARLVPDGTRVEIRP